MASLYHSSCLITEVEFLISYLSLKVSIKSVSGPSRGPQLLSGKNHLLMGFLKRWLEAIIMILCKILFEVKILLFLVLLIFIRIF